MRLLTILMSQYSVFRIEFSSSYVRFYLLISELDDQLINSLWLIIPSPYIFLYSYRQEQADATTNYMFNLTQFIC